MEEFVKTLMEAAKTNGRVMLLLDLPGDATWDGAGVAYEMNPDGTATIQLKIRSAAVLELAEIARNIKAPG